MEKTPPDFIESAKTSDIFEEKVVIPADGGPLEGELVYDPMGGRCDAVLLLSPHPNFAGTMDNNVIQTLARKLARKGYAALRFNYPGVGESAIELPGNQSAFDFWDDVEKHQRFEKATKPSLAALRFLKASLGEHAGGIHLAGYSFGGVIGMILASTGPGIKSVTAISMPWISRYDYGFLEQESPPRFFITGDRDFAFEKEVFDRVWPGVPEPKNFFLVENDHFFRKGESGLAEKVLKILERFA